LASELCQTVGGEFFFLLCIVFLEVGKTHDLPSKFWQTLGDALSNLGPSHSEVAEKHVKKSESETRVSNVSLPYPPIVSHVDMEFTCQSINLFRCHTTVAEHSNLPVNRKKATFFIFYIMRDKNIQQS
jgi:hypothetical protein